MPVMVESLEEVNQANIRLVVEIWYFYFLPLSYVIMYEKNYKYVKLKLGFRK